MYLKSLQINGFKSFKDLAKLDFTTNIVGIVGPNGSGKSNVAESFRFVLGEQSMKNMRGKRGEDLIFSGHNTKLNRASVKLIFNNNDGVLPIDFQEVVIERVVFRDGTNEYYINENRVRAKDVVSLLASANIGSTGHHIISQGEADKILSVNPKERKIMIEESLGLKSFVIQKHEANQKLNRTDNNLKEAKIKERVNAPRLRYLEREAKKIENRKNLLVQLKSLYQILFPQKKQLLQKIDKVENLIQELENEIKKIEEKIVTKREEKSNILNNDNSDNNIELEVSKIKSEIFELEKRRGELQKNIYKNDLEIENEKRKEVKEQDKEQKILEQKTEFNAKKQQVLDILNKYISDNEIINKIIVEILNFFGYSESDTFVSEFNIEVIENKKKENKILEEKLKNINEAIESLHKKNRLLESDNFDNKKEILSQEIEIEILRLEKEKGNFSNQLNDIQRQKFVLQSKIANIEKEEVNARNILSENDIDDVYKNPIFEEIENLTEKVMRIRIMIENLGDIKEDEILEEYQKLKDEQDFLKREILDLTDSRGKLVEVIEEVEKELEERFREGVKKINQEFSLYFNTLFPGGKASIFSIDIPLKKENEDDVQEFELGIDLKISLPNKKINSLGMLSGGERSLSSIALLFAISSVTPPPFIILDETDAALDEANSQKYGDMVEELAKNSQLILITHNRETMARAGVLYGITMNDSGTSKILSINLEKAVEVAK